MESIKSEWEKRARNAEGRLVQLVGEHEAALVQIKKIKKRAKLAERKQQGEQLEMLTRVKRQQDDLLFQKEILKNQFKNLNFAKLVMSELIIIKREMR